MSEEKAFLALGELIDKIVKAAILSGSVPHTFAIEILANRLADTIGWIPDPDARAEMLRQTLAFIPGRCDREAERIGNKPRDPIGTPIGQA